ncbi:aldo-keto reductase superfamily protein LALA0_S14e01794g [Lachancea lanzarotensis]|uniref:LALA0S14e01794g1_1 n=1 Tax=Lachancea lanzarotensis TaxID=1245769 RepID=A0A0C7NGP5_9SACH|nr:uncharacterized protein LALA0_S14e01794g [Lachancea lanzarotensis]CEP64900.1 LALA0S14e01794g1_1 [Lachancea lanzarotensis]
MKLPTSVRLGNSGLKISRLIVGCMSYGLKEWQDWVIEDKEEVFKLLKHCYDNGLRTYDTADVYSYGESERLLGEFLKHYNIDRETVVILTKIFSPVKRGFKPFGETQKPSPMEVLELENQRGLSRKHILHGVQQSVERLGTYIDVLQVHRLDRETPMEEIMRALNDVVESGQVRYLGASTMRATEFVELQFIAEKHGWFKFISSQSCYNLLYREDEKELIPFAQRHQIGLIPWSPLARGSLTKPVGGKSNRSVSDAGMMVVGEVKDDSEIQIISRVQEVAGNRSVSMAMVSTAWVLKKGLNPILGLSSIERIDEAIKALELELTDDEVKYLEEPYQTKKLIF